MNTPLNVMLMHWLRHVPAPRIVLQVDTGIGGLGRSSFGTHRYCAALVGHSSCSRLPAWLEGTRLDGTKR